MFQSCSQWVQASTAATIRVSFRGPAVGCTLAQARVLHAEGGLVVAKVCTLGGLRDEAPEHLPARAVDAAGLGAGSGRASPAGRR
ncbi:hypothetical protein LV78_007995 [Actinosynnema pretiosum]|nr:hypothetical protein [Actinosynnema pretiosum]